MERLDVIAKSWFNVLLDAMGFLPRKTKVEAQIRLSICDICPKLKNNSFCGQCGCPIIAKSLGNSDCPNNYWRSPFLLYKELLKNDENNISKIETANNAINLFQKEM